MARITETRRSSSLSLAYRNPTVSRELERELAQRWRRHGDTAARDLLVRAQLRHVVAIAQRYRRYSYATLEELIAEGNFGLVKALAKFDPERGTRFVTYAVYWIRAYISQYLIRSRSLVSAGVQSKVLPKIRRAREEILKTSGEGADVNDQVAERLALTPGKLHSLLERMDIHDVPWDQTLEDAAIAPFPDTPGAHGGSVEDRIMAAENGKRLSKAVSLLVAKLDERERYIVQRRLMAHREEELTLAEIGRHFGVSRERARQLEARAMRKVKIGLARSALGTGWLAGRDAA